MTIITPQDQKAIEGFKYFTECSFNSIDSSPDLITQFIMNAIYNYAQNILGLKEEDFGALPSSVKEWQKIATEFSREVKKYAKLP